MPVEETSRPSPNTWTTLQLEPQLIVCPVCGKEGKTLATTQGGVTPATAWTLAILCGAWCFLALQNGNQNATHRCSQCSVILGSWQRSSYPTGNTFIPEPYLVESAQQLSREPMKYPPPRYSKENSHDGIALQSSAHYTGPIMSPIGPPPARHIGNAGAGYSEVLIFSPNLPDTILFTGLKSKDGSGDWTSADSHHHTGYRVSLSVPLWIENERPAIPSRSNVQINRNTANKNEGPVELRNGALVGKATTHDGAETWSSTVMMEGKESFVLGRDRPSMDARGEAWFLSCRGWLCWRGKRLEDAYRRVVAESEMDGGGRGRIRMRNGLEGGSELVDEIVVTAMALRGVAGKERNRFMSEGLSKIRSRFGGNGNAKGVAAVGSS